MPSVMQSVGTPNGRHNFDTKYRETLDHVDPNLIQHNEIVQQKSVEDIYREKLQPAFESYNAKQKRNDRRLDVKWKCQDALGYQRALDTAARASTNKITQKGRPPIRELILQFGNPEQGYGSKNQTAENRNFIHGLLKEGLEEIKKRNPQFEWGDVVIHSDETSVDANGKECGSIHLHASFVPICYKNKQGPEAQVAFERCLKEMGFSSFEAWKHDLDDCMETVLERHGLTRDIMDNHEKHQSATEYHRQQQVIKETKVLEKKKANAEKELQEAVALEIESRVAVLPEQIKATPARMSKDKVLVSKSELDDLQARAKLSITHEESLRQREEALKAREFSLFVKEADYHYAVKEYDQLKKDLYGEVSSKKEKYERLYKEQVGLNEAFTEVKAENAQLKAQNASLRNELAKLKESVAEQIEAATAPLRAQIEQLREDVKKQREDFLAKLRNMALGENNLLAAIKHVATQFADGIGGAILEAAHRAGNRWLKEDGFESLAVDDGWMPQAVAKELQMQLSFEDGPDGRGVYSQAGTCVANVETIQEAREMFPNCEITDKTVQKVAEQQKPKSKTQHER